MKIIIDRIEGDIAICEIDGKLVGGKDPALIKKIQNAAWAEALEEVAAIKKEF